MSRAARLLRLVQALRSRRQPITAPALAQQLEVSPRTVYRDIETLRQQGATISGEAGVGYLLKPGFLLPPLMFGDDELEAIVLGLRLTSLHGDAALQRASIDVLGKLRAVLPRELRGTVDESGLLAGPPPERPAERVDLSVIRQALRNSHKASITYDKGDGVLTERRIWPLGLSFFERGRMVIAWCELREDYRCFRVDRVRSWETCAERIGRSRMAMLAEWRRKENISE